MTPTETRAQEYLLTHIGSRVGLMAGFAEEERKIMSDTKLACMFCSLLYTDFPLDVMVSDAVWKKITGKDDGSGVVCAACLVRKAAELLPNVTVAYLAFDWKLNNHRKVSLEEMFPDLNV